MALLEIEDLSIAFDTRQGRVTAVDGLSLSLEPGETLGLVGESGSGKSLTSLAILGLLPSNATSQAKRLAFDRRELSQMSAEERRSLRGGNIAMIFQDPMTSLNPSFTVGFQLKEVLRLHADGPRKQRHRQSIEILERVGISDAESRLEAFPHQLSGGMCQRVMIAMAMASRPRLLIADEPTTALDVTIQAQILSLLSELQREEKMAMILITHDIAIVSENSDRIAVMYAGEIVETGSTEDVLREPRHPYTAGLLNCLPANVKHLAPKERLPTLSGLVPSLAHRPKGCQFHPRCKAALAHCRESSPLSTIDGGRQFRCHYPQPPNRKEGAAHELSLA